MAKYSRDVKARLDFYSIRDPETGCWNWQSNRNRKGYGKVQWKGATWMAYRASWTAYRGEVPPGLELDHLCRNRACINPDHLEPVTHAENVRRGGNAVKTACPQGHPYDAPSIPGKGRVCTTCNRDRTAARDAAFLAGTHRPDPILSATCASSQKTHCPRGHEYSPDNTYLHRGRRFCRACNLIRGQEFRARKNASKVTAG